jgi:ADP-ribosylglycohydrolase
MIGVIAGDVIGSVHEHSRTKSTDFPLFDPRCCFTDDTVLTVATAYAILNGSSYETAYRDFGRRHPDAGYGGAFYEWLFSAEPRPYNSWGNGSAMRVTPVGLAFGSVEQVLREAERSAAVTHNHAEGIKGAKATALGVFMARSGASKEEIRNELVRRFGYDLRRSIDQIRPTYQWDVSCQGSVPEAIVAFLDSADVEHAIRLAISLGGDKRHAGGNCRRHGPTPFTDICPKGLRIRSGTGLPPEFIEVIDAFELAFPLAAGR